MLRRLGFTLVGIVAVGLSLIASAPGAFADDVDHVTEVDTPNCLQPPANSDLTTFSDQLLALYGLPPKPEQANAVANWRLNLEHAKHRICHYQHHSKGHRHSDYNNKHWAGNMDTGGGFTTAEASWTLPCTTSPSNAWSSAWAGIGGYPAQQAAQLIQSGSDSMVVNGRGVYQLWTEDFGPVYDDLNTISTFTPQCGDTVYAEDHNYGTWAYMTIADWTSNSYFDHSDTGTQWTDKSSISADWIVEGSVPEGNPLANFGSVHFHAAWTLQNGVGEYVGWTAHDAAYMCSDSFFGICGAGATHYATPGPISSNGQDFTVTWNNAS